MAQPQPATACCNSGCYVCAQELLAILGEVEAGMGTQSEAGSGKPVASG
jgi:hypothetical protein